ncbi:hypothetical protein KEM55_004103 [Ascosphaera atra]|nr:hypothetical protein KEM55_004103 [Ascosphaera atra]
MGDIVLSREELEKEEKNASVEEVVKQRGGPVPGKESKEDKTAQQKQQQSGDGLDAQADTATTTATTTIPAPRGFDRLLNAGFTPSEISAMRSQFLAMQSLSRTPDTMPSGDELRELEDRWIDEGISDAAGSAAAVGGGTGNGGGQGLSTADENYSGSLDDMMMGVTMGFFWPVGCGVWLLREEGVWSWRKGLAVAIGMIMNLSFGWIRFFG